MARIKVEGISQEEIERKVREHEKKGWLPIGKGITEHPDRWRSHKAAKFLCIMQKDTKDADRHRETRLRLGLTMKQVADRTYTSLQSIVRYENGQAIPSEEHFKRLEGLQGEIEKIEEAKAAEIKREKDNWSEFVRTAMITVNMPTDEFAKAMNMTPVSIQYWVNGTSMPKKNQREMVAKQIKRLVTG